MGYTNKAGKHPFTPLILAKGLHQLVYQPCFRLTPHYYTVNQTSGEWSSALNFEGTFHGDPLNTPLNRSVNNDVETKPSQHKKEIIDVDIIKLYQQLVNIYKNRQD